MVQKTLKILAPTRYPWRFNSPRNSRHTIARRRFLPFNYFAQRYEGITAFPIRPFEHFDLIHAFNRIPLNRKPYVIGFESHLPRGFGIEDGAFFAAMARSLASDRCRAVVAISDWARRMMWMQHRDRPWAAEIECKLLVRLPSIELPETPPPIKTLAPPIRLFFVGNHFARKGGCVALRLAKLAHDRGLPIEIDIVSNMEIGAVSWTDPADPQFFDRYRPLLDLPNVRHTTSLPNDQVVERLKRAHLVLLPTFGDTFGYSAIEGLLHAKPVIATDQCALPEFIRDGENGYLLPLETNEKDEWVLLGSRDRDSRDFERRHGETVDQLAELIFSRLQTLLETPSDYRRMAMAAFETVRTKFDAQRRDRFWDQLYETALHPEDRRDLASLPQ